MNNHVAVLNTLLETTTQAIITFDIQGNFCSINDNGLEVLGLQSSSDCKAMNLFSFIGITPTQKDKLLEGEVLRFRKDFELEELQNFIPTRLKGVLFVEASVKSIVCPSGINDGFLLILRNITQMISQQREFEKNDFKSRELMKGNGMVTWEYDVISGELSYEGTLSEYIGIVPTAEHLLQYIHPDNCEAIRDMFQKVKAGTLQAYTQDVKFIMPEFSFEMDVKFYATPYQFDANGKAISYIGYTRNVSDNRNLISSLRLAREKAEQADKLKSAFLANMSHEIRTPLNAIIGFSELLSETETEEEKENYMHQISMNNERLLRLINDILDLSKLESGVMSIQTEKCDFVEFFDDLMFTLKSHVLNSNVEFICVNPYEKLIVEIDKNRIAQVITNFVTNSIKYIRKGYIKVYYEFSDGQLKVSVKDSGIGIAPEKQHLVFQRFEKLDDFAQGTGLGLAIVKAITELLDGTYGFNSILDKGSCFWASFPLEPFEFVPRKSADAALNGKAKCKGYTINPQEINILIAEDNDNNFQLFQHVLKDYNLVRVYNGVQAVEKMRNERFDIVLMDMRMPELDGIDATTAIREFDTNTLIVLVASSEYDVSRISAVSAGCNDYISKPIRKQQLLSIIQKHLLEKKDRDLFLF